MKDVDDIGHLLHICFCKEPFVLSTELVSKLRPKLDKEAGLGFRG